MKKLITAQEFEKAFRSQWEEDKHSREEDINEAYNGPWQNWTKFMLGIKDRNSQDAFFYRVLQKLEKKDIDFAREWYTLDAIYHRCESVYKEDYPPCMDVLIEHENNYEQMEEEMWKLSMFRSPLKVLVSYDWDEKEKTTPHRMSVLKNKLDKLADMARQIDGNWKEAEDTEYLIVIGNRNADDDIIWKFKKLTKSYKWGSNS